MLRSKSTGLDKKGADYAWNFIVSGFGFGTCECAAEVVT
jgi:hypothetical protein